MKQIKLQYKISIILISTGLIISIILFNTFWSLLGLMFIGGGLILAIIYYEQKWIKRKYLKWGLTGTLIFSIVYGILEYTLFDSPWNNYFKISDWFPDMYYYWAFMTILNFSIIIIASRGSIAMSLSSIPLFATNEDLWYWLSQSIHELNYVFPVSNWFDKRFPFLRGLGEPLPFFPYFPRFYLVGWILISILLIIQFKNLQGKKFIISILCFITACFGCLLLIPVFF
ncbi:MAG: hypothetical protein ACTSQO_06320 [Candidatus Helarchaeota archaeon]